MSIDANPTCPSISRLAEDLKLNGKSPRKLRSYCRALRKFSEFLGHAPEKASEEHLRAYLLLVTEKRQWSALFFISVFNPCRVSGQGEFLVTDGTWNGRKTMRLKSTLERPRWQSTHSPSNASQGSKA